jgi:RNA polymerase sigma-70 factor (ECF subfamily)
MGSRMAEHPDDVALAAACAAGDATALATFERLYGDDLVRLHARWRKSRISLDDFRQELRRKLFVGDGRGPAIAGYGGRGSLRAWVCMCASRLLVDLARPKSASEDCDDLAEALDPGGDVQAAYLKAELRGHVREAIHEALAQLSPRERNLLRQRYLEGVAVDAIASLYGMHRVSASRALGVACDRLLAAVRERLAARVGGNAPELDAIVGTCRSQLELSLERVLG